MSKEKHAGSRSKNFKSVSEMKAEIDKYFLDAIVPMLLSGISNALNVV